MSKYLIDGKPLLESLEFRDNKVLISDFAYDALTGNVKLVTCQKNSLKVWTYTVPRTGFPNYKDSKNLGAKMKNPDKYTLEYEIDFPVYDPIRTFYLNNKHFLVTNDLNIYELTEVGANLIQDAPPSMSKGLESHSLIIDNDSDKAFIVPKRRFNDKSEETFQTLLNKYGVEIKL